MKTTRRTWCGVRVVAGLLALTVGVGLPATADAAEQRQKPRQRPKRAPRPQPAPAPEPAPTPEPAPATPEVTTTPPAPAPPPPPPAPYSLPWHLRSAGVGNGVRLDTSFAFYDAATGSGSTVASMFTASYKVTPSLAPFVRLGFVRNADPAPMPGTGSALINPVIGASYGWKVGTDLRVSALLAAALPFGMGGDKPAASDGAAAALARGVPARSAMDSAMFAVNYFTASTGVDVAWVANDLTVQAEITVLQLFRARNEALTPESTRTNSTAGLHVGYFFFPWLSVGGELRHQRWLSTPNSVNADPTTRETSTFALGPRFHFKLGDTSWIRPGISYAAALDPPMTNGEYRIVTVDVPVAF
jgi:hypothetical protein